VRILLVEDDPLLGDGLRAGLRQRGFQVDWVRDGAAAARGLRAEPYAAAVLDLGLPRKDGLQVLRETRLAGISLPVLVLTARDAIPDRVHGLDAGADDYVVKPVDLHELATRLRASARVRINVDSRDGRVVLSVEDSGPAMSQADAGRLGERFFRVAGSAESGSGLGWSIVRRIAEVHGLEMKAERSTDLGGLAVCATTGAPPVAATDRMSIHPV
jgi:two-component system OmpR family response regulator/two-component system response regulator QseB